MQVSILDPLQLTISYFSNILPDPLVMVCSKATHFDVQREAIAVATARAANDPPPLPQISGDQVLMNSPSGLSPQDFVEPKTSRGVFHPLPFLGFTS